MNETPVQTACHAPCSVEDWDILRSGLQGTVIARTSLHSLAKGVGLKWPVRGKQETPDRYLHSTLAELADMPEFYGKGNRLALLYTILLETRRMEDPFDDMTRHLEQEAVGAAEAECAPLFAQLEIPETFPVELMNFSERTLTLCRDGGYATLGQLCEFLRESGSAASINDEFRRFIGCLDYRDGDGLRHFLPLRAGRTGLFLPEALGLLGRRMTAPQAATLLYAYQISTTRPAWGEEAALPRTEALALIARVKRSAEKCFELMPDQAQHLRGAIQAGLSTGVRHFVPLAEPDLEGLALAIAMAALDVKPRLKGFIGRLLN